MEGKGVFDFFCVVGCRRRARETIDVIQRRTVTGDYDNAMVIRAHVMEYMQMSVHEKKMGNC